METLEHGTTRIAYELTGNENGPRVVLLHGLFLNSDCWKYQIEALQQDYRVLRFDLYGHGRSLIPHKRFTIRNYVTDMEILLKHIGWDSDLNLVGHSLGGMVALVYALEHRSAVRRMVVASSYCFVSNEAMTDVLGRVKSNKLEKFALGIGKRGLSPYDEEKARWLAEMVTRYMTQKDALYATAASAGFNICESLRDLDVPVLLIVGEKDITTPVWASEMLHEWLPDSEIVIVKGAGHLVIVDHPDEFNQHMLAFLSGE